MVLDHLKQSGDSYDQDRAKEIRQAAQSKINPVSWSKSADLNWEPRPRPNSRVTFRQLVSPTKIQAGQQFEGWALVSDSANAISLRDSAGLIRRVPTEPLQSRNGEDRKSKICGGFLAVMTTNGLSGVDMFRLHSGGGDAVFWNRSFGVQGMPLARSTTETNPFNDKVIRYYMISSGAKRIVPELKLGPILGDRLIVLQGGDLLAIDLLSGETLWRNSNAPNSGVVLADGDRVAVVSPASRRQDFFNVMDGRKLGTAKWGHGKIWAAAGTNVLSFQDRPDKQIDVKLVNPFTDTVLLQHQSIGANRKQSDMPGAYGRVVAGRYMALYASDGQAIVWDVREGREVSNVKLTEYSDLQGLQVALLQDQIVLLPQRRQRQSSRPMRQQMQTRTGSVHQTVDGVHAISLTDGKVRWQRDFVKSWGFTLTQPAESPLLMFSRSYLTVVPENRSRRKSLEVLALSVRDGSELHEAKKRPIRDGNTVLETRLTIQTAESQVIAVIGSETLTYTFEKTNEGGEE